jgi:hypothetical protein
MWGFRKEIRPASGLEFADARLRASKHLPSRTPGLSLGQVAAKRRVLQERPRLIGGQSGKNMDPARLQ